MGVESGEDGGNASPAVKRLINCHQQCHGERRHASVFLDSPLLMFTVSGPGNTRLRRVFPHFLSPHIYASYRSGLGFDVADRVT